MKLVQNQPLVYPYAINIRWNSLTFAEWQQRFDKVSRSTLLQSYAYAQAICPLERMRARWGLILIDNQEVGLVQILEAGLLKNLVHAVILDRGPLWFEGFGGENHFKVFVQEFDRQFPRRLGRRRRFIPEVQKNPEIEQFLKDHGFRKHNQAGYETIWLDLRKDLETLRAALKKKWRNILNKAERGPLTVKWDEDAADFEWLMQRYVQDKTQKNYQGASVSLLRGMAQTFGPAKNMLIGNALLDNRPVAAILILCHGSSATYQIGWTSQDGRDHGAHHLLLFDALRVLQDKHIQDFDLGGINDESGAGVKKFKQGMGGEQVSLPGIYG